MKPPTIVVTLFVALLLASHSHSFEINKHRSQHIMTNVNKSKSTSEGTPYLTRLEDGCIPLVTGNGKGRSPLLERPFGTIPVNESENDTVAWAWENEWGDKVFGTSFGHPADFAEEDHNRMLLNRVHWAVNKPLPGPDAKITTW